MKRHCITWLLLQREKAQTVSLPAGKEMEGMSPSVGDPFVSAAAVPPAVAEAEPALDGVGKDGDESGRKI